MLQTLYVEQDCLDLGRGDLRKRMYIVATVAFAADYLFNSYITSCHHIYNALVHALFLG